MGENQDVGASGLEGRIRELFADGASDRVVSASGVIDGARRRRVRHRATAAGSSVAMLGIAAGAIAFAGGHAAGSSGAGTGAGQSANRTAPVVSVPTGPKTCAASVTGTVPGTSAVTRDGLVFETVSGKTQGIPWAVQIHVFPNKWSHTMWQEKLPAGTIPPSAVDAEHSGPMAQFRTPETQGYTEVGGSDGTSGDKQYFTIQEGMGIGPSSAAKPTEQAFLGDRARDYPAYVTSGWMGNDVDHLCVQYAGHAEFEPVYRIQGGRFFAFGYSATDRPQKVIGYNAAGAEVGSATATKSGPFFLLSLPGNTNK